MQPQVMTSGSHVTPADGVSTKPKNSKSPTGRRVTALDPVRESTPVNDLRDVSMYLKQPVSPIDSTPPHSPPQRQLITPSSLPALPPSPSGSLIEHGPTSSVVNVIGQPIQHDLVQSSRESLALLRSFLSNSRNIWSLTAIWEMIYILYTLIQWTTVELPLSPSGDSSLIIPFPQWAVFQTHAFWMTIVHWAIPTLVIPAIVGSVVSFNPATPNMHSPLIGASQTTPFDPLTAAIIRLAAQVGYPYTGLEQELPHLDVVGFRWRVLNASVSLAFSFAEAIARAPQAFVDSLIREQRSGRLLPNGSPTERLKNPPGTTDGCE